VDAVLKTRKQMQDVLKAAGGSSAGGGANSPARAGMAAAVDQADRIAAPANLSVEGKKAFGELFGEGGKGTYRLRPVGGRE